MVNSKLRSRTRHRRGLLLLALSCALALLVAPTAQAKFLKAIWGPEDLPASAPACAGTGEECSPFPIYKELGVDIVQFQVHWDEVAPTQPANPRDPADPAYRWGPVDKYVERAAQAGLELGPLIQRSPPWANGNRSPIWAPKKPQDFADFVYAASLRYPTIHHWMIWGEPSRVENFRPMKDKSPKGPRIYAEILDRSYVALKKASKKNIVIGANTLNGGTMKPPMFLKYMKLANGLPPRMDLWGTNPFDARYPRLADDTIGRFRGFNDIDTLYAEIKKAYKEGHRRVPKLWLSEWTIVSDRPLPLFSNFFVTREGQATRLNAAYTIARRTPYVAGLGWFTLMDQAVIEGGAGWGLLDAQGDPKPAFVAYKALP